MSYDDIQNLWQSPGNRPSPAEQERERARLVDTLRRQHRAFRRRLGLAVGWLAVSLVILAGQVLSGRPFSVAREWAVLPLMVLPWVAAVLFIRRQLRHQRAHAGFEDSVSRTVRALLDANHAAQQRARIMQILLALSAPIMAACIWQLQAVGKTRPQEAASLATVMAVLIAGSFAGTWWHARRLRPEERRLAGLLAALQD